MRFSLRTLFIGITIVAALLGLAAYGLLWLFLAATLMVLPVVACVVTLALIVTEFSDFAYGPEDDPLFKGDMRFFLAGIMQGSHLEAVLHHQGYRHRLREAIEQAFPGASVYDPLADHRESLGYDDAKGRDVFFHHNRLCREVDVLVAFVPEASMGTAIEMWEAHEHGRAAVFTISPLAHNWAVRFCSHAVYADFESFEAALASGEVAKRVEEVRSQRSVDASS